jgi:hypothetical protein
MNEELNKALASMKAELEDKNKESIQAVREELVKQVQAGNEENLKAIVAEALKSQPELKDNAEFVALKQVVEAMKSVDSKKTIVPFGDSLKAEHKEIFDKIERNERVDASINIKAEMDSSNVGNFPTIPMTDNAKHNMAIARGSGRKVVDSFNSVNVDTDIIIESYEASKTGTPAYLAENADTIEMKYTTANVSFECRRTGVHTIIPNKMMRSYSYFTNKVNDLLNRDLIGKVAGKMLTADGTGEDFKGLTSLGTAFSAAATGLEGRLGTLTSADIVKILIAVQSQGSNAEYGLDKIYLNPTDVYLMKISALNATAEITEAAAISNLMSMIVTSTKVTAGSFIACESALVTNYISSPLRLQIVNNDSARVKADNTLINLDLTHTPVLNPQHTASIIYGTFAAAATDLNS